ncbi:phosphoglycerate dehydrogenase [Reichenbachiella sp.]|uniref:phosphoglycerate dehydrogenase n=1 Tax=Reichenbachiella sp. TaxID=2184521 RepID=UPI003BB1C735
MDYKVLISAPYLQPFIERFRPFFHKNNIEIIVPNVKERLEEEDLLKYIEDLDGIICGDDKFTPLVLDKAKKLKVISKWGTGIDSINKPACEERGIAVRNTPNAFTVPVSDSVLAYILNFARNISFMDRAMKSGEWKKINGHALHEATLGVIGVGNIGESVLRKAQAFGMNLIACDLKPIPTDLLIELNIEQVSLDTLLTNSDYVSVNCDLNETSHHLMSDSAFDLMKETAILINSARGPIVDEIALVRALENNKIGGAALDVFELEPLPLDSPLLQMPNVLLAPHNTNSSKFAWEKVHINTINNLMDSLNLEGRL